jgi:endonuclease/exonuclease/phosphatase family metal-dependent hydrolase
MRRFVFLLLCFCFGESILLGAFNCQIFGVAKMMADPSVVDAIIKILTRYDILFFQEIRDVSNTAIFRLLNQTNNLQRKYEMLLSARLGRTSSKEQYAYFYDPAVVAAVGAPYVYEDLLDLFERPPFIAEFQERKSGFSFFSIGIHAKPEAAIEEMNAMVDVYESVRDAHRKGPTLLIGDFNADCQYVAQSAWPRVNLFTDARFAWWIKRGTDTTTKASDCTFDRIVSVGFDNVTLSDAAVFRYDLQFGLDETTTQLVSDHYPVEIRVEGPVGSQRAGVIVGVLFGVIAGVSLLVLLAVFVYKNRDNGPSRHYKEMEDRFVAVDDN